MRLSRSVARVVRQLPQPLHPRPPPLRPQILRRAASHRLSSQVEVDAPSTTMLDNAQQVGAGAAELDTVLADAKVSSYSPPATPPPASAPGSGPSPARSGPSSPAGSEEGAEVAFEENKLMGLSLRGRIARVAQRDDYETAAATWDDAIARQIELDHQSHVHMLAACTTLPSGPQSRKVSNVQQVGTAWARVYGVAWRCTPHPPTLAPPPSLSDTHARMRPPAHPPTHARTHAHALRTRRSGRPRRNRCSQNCWN